jgi:hypothetical protein
MAATPGNQWWRLRAKHGRDLIFSTPEILWESAVEYFEETDKRKWIKEDWVGKDAIKVDRKVDTPYTLSGLCLFLECDEKTFKLYESREDFIPVTTRIRQIMFTQKFEGATVGAFNANIIARDLGLKDQTDVTTNGNDISQNTIFEVTRRK